MSGRHRGAVDDRRASVAGTRCGPAQLGHRHPDGPHSMPHEMRMFQTALSGLFVDGPSTCRIGSGIPLVVHAVRVGSLSAYGPMRAG